MRPHCLGVVHVPKAGGSAIRSALATLPRCYSGPSYYDALHFGSDALRRGVPEPNRGAITTPEVLAGIVAEHDYVIGHYGAQSLIAAGCRGLAVQVREPRARVLSLYRFWQAQSEIERGGWGLWGTELSAKADLPLVEFLRSPSVWPAVDNAMLRQLLARRSAPGPRRAVPSLARLDVRARYSRLCTTLRVVEWSDRSERFIARICETTGVATVPELHRENVTRVDAAEQVIDPQTARLLNVCTGRERALLDRLCGDGLLVRRSERELDDEFAIAAERLGFRIDARPGQLGDAR